jgi:hypothetical protein
MAKGNGIESKGKTKGKNLGDSGPTVGLDKLKKGPGGKTNDAMKAVGRNFAKLKANGK